MATANTQEGSRSSQPSDPVDRMNGDTDLDFTITMNESEDEASSDDLPSSEPVQKGDNKPVSSHRVNGNTETSDDLDSADTKGVQGGETEEPALKDDGCKEQEMKSKVLNQINGGEESKEQESEADVASDTLTNTEGEGKGDPKVKPVQNDKKDGQSGGTDIPESKEQADQSPGNAKKSFKCDEKNNENEIDDDVVEIDDFPEEEPLGKGRSGEIGMVGARDKLNTSNIKSSLSTSATANNPNIPCISLSGASLLPSASGVQLVLSQGTAGMQGSSLMYVPNNGAFLGAASSSSVFNPTMANSIQSRSGMYQQRPNMMANQANRFATSFNQGPRPGIVPSVLTNIPDKPTSSVGMIDMIRWEVENHINIKPKYVKPNPKAELGHLAKWMFDLGSDLVKEYVYHDLVRIQHRRKDEGSLSNKEKEDFNKLQEIDKELNQKVGHLKIRLTKSCRCGFRTELNNVMYNHKQHAHIARGGFLNCSLCKFSTRQPNAFRFHMETEHGRAGVIENRPSFYECSLCPYETNYTNRLEQHKVRCQRQFREAFNLHPSCISGPEVSLCLENVFYFVFTRQFMNTIIPKPPTSAPSSSTKIRDMPSKSAVPANSLLAGRATGNTLTSSSKQLMNKKPVQYPQRAPAPITAKQQQHPNASVSHGFPATTSKMNTVPNQAVAPTHSPNPNQRNDGFEVCEICGGYVKDRKALRIHFFYAHRIDMPFGVFERPLPPLYCATCFARFWTAQGLQKHIEVHKNDMMGTTQTSNGVAGKCISCGHRVPNILMHMRMVHNRELRHYLAALMCIFCGSRFITKTEVEAHMGKMHGVIVKNSNVQGSMAQTPVQNRSNANFQARAGAPVSKQPAVSKQQANTTVSKGGKSGKISRASQCVLCNLSFARNVDLTRHCMRVHHTCMKCGLVVVDKESLARHTCLHSASGMRTCQICKESGFHPAYYIKHMRDKHLRKCSVVLRHIDRAVVETMKRPITISDSEDDETVSKPTEVKRQKTDVTSEAVKEESNIGVVERKMGEEDRQKSLEKEQMTDAVKTEEAEAESETPAENDQDCLSLKLNDNTEKGITDESKQIQSGKESKGKDQKLENENDIGEKSEADTDSPVGQTNRQCEDGDMNNSNTNSACVDKDTDSDTACVDKREEKDSCKTENSSDMENAVKSLNTSIVFDDSKHRGTSENKESPEGELGDGDDKLDSICEHRENTLNEMQDKGDHEENLQQKRKVQECEDHEENPASKKLRTDIQGQEVMG